jgi:pyruvate formate lyase activating enzyme
MTLGVHEARYWHPVEGGKIQCDLCPRHCRLSDGQRAFCFVRERQGDRLLLSTYGKSTGFCVDPIEKKPLNHFLPGTPVLSFGTAGCNLGCRFCQNWSISKSKEVARLSETASPEGIARAAHGAGCRSVAFTYNDPVIWAEYAIDTAKACHQLGLKTVAVTAGYITESARGDFFEHLDAANVDLKAFTQHFYKKLCFADIQPILDTLIWLKEETQVWVEVTTLLIPGQNDSNKELELLSAWFADNMGPDVPLHFSGFHPDFKMRDTRHTPLSTLQRARAIALEHGLRYVYTGNVHDQTGDTTFCHGCGDALIVRDWYQMVRWNLRDGACKSCGTAVAGVFESTPGTWGAKREALRIGG